MHPLIDYILKVNALLLMFWIVYRLALRKETFYTPIRFYFLVSIALSFSLPFVTFQRVVYIEEIPVAVQAAVPASSGILPETAVSLPEPSLWQALSAEQFFLYSISLISLFCFFRVVYSGIRLVRKIKTYPAATDKNIRIACAEPHVYSFYRWVVVPENVLASPDFDMILQHEKIHLNQKHSFDLLCIELVSAVFWFNPLIKYIRRDINLNLEYTVDEIMNKQNNSLSYQKSLVQFYSQKNRQAFVNSFNASDLKKRILQLNTQKSIPMKKLKLLLAAPLLVCFFILFQIDTIAQTVIHKTTADKKNDIVVEKTTETFSIDIVNNASKEDLASVSKILKQIYNVEAKFSGIKRNKQHYITALTVHITNEKQKITKKVKGATPINSFKINVESTENGLYNVFFKDISKASTNQTQKTAQKFTFNLENLQKDKAVFNEVKKKYTIEVDGKTLTGNTLDQFDNSKIKAMTIVMNPSDVEVLGDLKKSGILKLSTKKDAFQAKGVEKNYTIHFTEAQNKENNTIITDNENNITVSGSTVITIDTHSKQDLLYIVDGREIATEDFNKIHPADIENITVLKDANAEKTYGSKGKDGVLIITTKSQKGKKTDNKQTYIETDKLRKKSLAMVRKAQEKMAKELEERKKVQTKMIAATQARIVAAQEKQKAVIERAKEEIKRIELQKKEIDEKRSLLLEKQLQKAS